MPSNTIRIAKNTLMLYFRQILIMLVSLYTVRIKLEILGVENYGIFNVVGGIVVLFTFLNSAMTGASQRFLSFALGQNDTEQAQNVYSASIVIHALIAVLVVILAQTVGLWFFNTWLNIPEERQTAAFIVYQFSIAATVLSVLRVPYRATIIAYEKMSFFAMLSIVEAILMLGVALLLPIILFDSLIVYAFLVCIIGIVILLVYKLYCNKVFEIAHFRHCRDKKLFRQLLGFSGWSAFGGFANISRNQGINILLNIFHGVTVNAAMGIATQVNSAVNQFLTNFQVASSPQIVKLYATKDYDSFMQLIFRTSKISFCLLLFFILPLYVNTDFVLGLWLVKVPEYTVEFIRLIFLFSLIGAIANPLTVSIKATGNIKKFQLVLSCFMFANLPLSLLLLWIGFNPAWVLIIKICLRVLAVIWEVLWGGKMIRLPVKKFLCEVIIPIFTIAIISTIFIIFLQNFFSNNWSRLAVSCIASIVSIGCLMYWVGLNKQEKVLLQNWLKVKIGKSGDCSK